MYRMKIFPCLLIFIVVGPGLDLTRGAGQTASPPRLEVSRDAWVSAVGHEADGNNGGAPRLKLKSIQEMSLLDIDEKPLVGRTIRRAALLHR